MQFDHSNDTDDSFWANVADMMAGVMIVFLFIAVVLLLKVEGLSERVDKNRMAIYEQLSAEFEDDLPRWRAKIDKDKLSVIFEDPNVMFSRGSKDLKTGFITILTDFCPRFVNILAKTENKKFIDEIRVEGHTSSEGLLKHTPLEAFNYNMELSQARSFNVMKLCLTILPNSREGDWARMKIRANGYSSSQLIFENGEESKEKSRRVEFRVSLEKESVLKELVRWSRARKSENSGN